MTKLTLAQIKAKSTGYFFSKESMRFFKGMKYKVKYDPATDTNFVIGTHPDGRIAKYKFNEADGTLNYVGDKK